MAVAWVSCAAAETCTAVSLIVVTRLRKRLDREIDRVRDRAGDVLGDGRLDGQVAFGQGSHFVQQAQNRLLVALVELGGLLVAALLVADQVDAEEQQQQQCAGRGDGAPDRVREQALGGQLVDALGHADRAQQHALAVGEARLGGVLDLLQIVRGVKDILDRCADRGPLRGDVADDLLGVGVVERFDVEFGGAVEQAADDGLVQARIALQAGCGRLGVVAAGEDLADPSAHAIGELHLARGDVHLRGAGVLVGENVDDFAHARVQRGQLVGEVPGTRVGAEHGLLVDQDLAGVALQLRPGLAQGIEFRTYDLCVTRHAGLVAGDEVAHVGVDVVACAVQLLERKVVAAGCFRCVFGQLLRQHLDLRRVGNGLSIVAVVQVQEHEIDDCEHEKEAEQDKQHRIGAASALASKCT